MVPSHRRHPFSLAGPTSRQNRSEKLGGLMPRRPLRLDSRPQMRHCRSPPGSLRVFSSERGCPFRQSSKPSATATAVLMRELPQQGSRGAPQPFGPLDRAGQGAPRQERQRSRLEGRRPTERRATDHPPLSGPRPHRGASAGPLWTATVPGALSFHPSSRFGREARLVERFRRAGMARHRLPKPTDAAEGRRRPDTNPHSRARDRGKSGAMLDRPGGEPCTPYRRPRS